MTNKLTQDFISEEYKKKEYILINEYQGSHTMLFVKDKEGYICSSVYHNFKIGNIPKKFYKTNPYTIQNIKLWIKNNAEGYELLSTEYKNAKEKLLFKCPKGHEFKLHWSNFQHGCRCTKCSHHQPSEETVIYNSASWMMDLGVSEQDAKKYLPQSSRRITVICPNCNKQKETTPCNIYNTKSISCSCGDGVSYPEKFIISMISQLNIKYRHDNYYIQNKRYDFYFEYNDKKYIIECHGEQHYRYTGRGRTLQEEQENDKIKKQLALSNGIDEYIVLDCRKSDLNYIKNSIMNSKLNNIFDLNNIVWFRCEKFALSNRIKEVCEYWNQKEEWETTINLIDKFNLNNSTICKYLRKGTKLGWCNYNGKEEMKKQASKNGKLRSKPVEIFKDGESLGVFPSCSELERQSKELFGVKLNHSKISAVCLGKQKQHKCFTFKYYII